MTGGENSDGTNDDSLNAGEDSVGGESSIPKVLRKAKIKTGLGHGKTKKKKKPPPATTQPVSAMATTSAQGWHSLKLLLQIVFKRTVL